MKYVLAVFAKELGMSNRSPTRYCYMVPTNDEPKVGDLIITSVSWDHKEMPDHWTNMTAEELSKELIADANIARIISISPASDEIKKATRYYIACVSMQDVADRAVANARHKEREEQRLVARERLDKMIAERERMPEYEKLAAENPEAAKLLELLKGV